MKKRSYLLCLSILFVAFHFTISAAETHSIADHPSKTDAVLLCTPPTDIEITQVGYNFAIWWTSDSLATAHEIVVGIVGFDPNGIDIVAEKLVDNGSSFATVGGLESGFSYDIYIRALCGNGETSAFIGPIVHDNPAACGDVFYDPAGPNGPYLNEGAFQWTICPDEDDYFVQIVFDEFDIDPCCAKMSMDRGYGFFDVSADQGLPITVTSAYSQGCLTLAFDAFASSVNGQNWKASVNCVRCPAVGRLTSTESYSTSTVFYWPTFQYQDLIHWEIGLSGYTPGMGQELAIGSSAASSNEITVENLSPSTGYDVYLSNECIEDITENAGPYPLVTAPECGQRFYDPGGSNEGYIGRQIDDAITIICPEQPGYGVELVFTEMDIDPDFTELVVFDGNEYGESVLVWVRDSIFIPPPLVSSHSSGCLTVWHESNSGDGLYTGWAADVNCVDCPNIGDLSVNYVAPQKVKIKWNYLFAATSYEWEMGLLGFTPWSGEATEVGTLDTNEVMLDGLEASAVYEFYVKAHCPNGVERMVERPLQFGSPGTCGNVFYDPGGPNGLYDPGLSVTTTFCPDVPDERITAHFNFFNTQVGSDRLSVFDGIDCDAEMIGSFSGSFAPPPLAATNPTGCLTFLFESNGNASGLGWEAIMECGSTTIEEDHFMAHPLLLYPNPADSHISIVLTAPIASEAIFQINDMTGRLVLEKNISLSAGENTINENVSALSAGIYFIVLKNGDGAGVLKLVKY